MAPLVLIVCFGYALMTSAGNLHAWAAAGSCATATDLHMQISHDIGM